ncbi:MAG TPA: calcium incorporation protein MxaA [Methylibium sp.]|uniref:calcium incorporation protein MxaA n=1 Tax=Methylibium sp. TaxID=2067992 RepID=UPI002DBC2C64|nr:calcium incorporation protein MxaA [Methylibium sp.]HEU4460506.1 calcium incorporation protein MxaA [Methylibium sp.]
MKWPSLLAAAAIACSGAFAADTVEQPRSFGHVLGDVLTQRVLLAPGAPEFAAAALPPADRVGLWFERRAPRIERDAEGRRWLAVDYQVINAPRALTAVALPALSLARADGSAVSLPAWPVSLGPLTPPEAFGQGGLTRLRPEREVAPRPTAAIEAQLRAALLALAGVLLAWLGWWLWRNRREAQRLPFARAWGRVRRLDESAPQAWLALHEAINATAGHAVHAATLGRFLSRAPHLQALQDRLEGFFRHSGERFFAEAPAASPFPLRELSRLLHEAERRHRR